MLSADIVPIVRSRRARVPLVYSISFSPILINNALRRVVAARLVTAKIIIYLRFIIIHRAIPAPPAPVSAALIFSDCAPASHKIHL